jgi:adiponectin receptor
MTEVDEVEAEKRDVILESVNSSRIEEASDDTSRIDERTELQIQEFENSQGSDDDPPKLPIVGEILDRIEREEATVEREEKIEEHSVGPLPQQTSFKLCSFDETPEFLRRPFILNHYRVYFSYNLCFASLFKLHNETFNVWTHLIGFLIFIILFIYTCIIFSVGYGSGDFLIGDLIVMVVYCLLALNCFLSSTCYHLFGCKSAKAWHMCYKCDLSAISGLIGGSFIPALYYNLYCDQVFQIFYICMICVLAFLGMLFPFIPMHRGDKWSRIFRILRTSLFICIVLSAVVPIFHWLVFLLPSHKTGFGPENWIFLCGMLLMLGLYAVGLFFWLTRIPERLMPGYFDIWFSSHQIWHILIVAAACIWYAFMVRLYRWKISNQYRCYSV